MKKFFARATFSLLTFILCIVLSQDCLLFPGVVFAKLGTPGTAPAEIESFGITAADGVQLEMWRMTAAPEGIAPGRRAAPLLFLHGNGGSMADFFPLQRWLSRLGFTAYAIDTRGFGRSSGWPSERGIELDVEAAVREIARREKTEVRDVALAGSSIGTGAAAYGAAKFQSRILILLSPYSNLRERASEDPLFGRLSPLLWYDFPTSEYVGSLSSTCVVLAHGLQDTIIHPSHSDAIAAAYRGKTPLKNLRIPFAGHNDLVFRGGDVLNQAIGECQISAPFANSSDGE